MTEKERLLGLDQPEHMLVELWNKGSIRKCRAFGLSLCRELTHHFNDPRIANALSATERWIRSDHHNDLDLARRLAIRGHQAARQGLASGNSVQAVAALCVVQLTTLRFPHPSLDDLVQNAQSICSSVAKRSEFRAKQAELLREVFQHHFIPVNFDRRWLTSTVVDLATMIYEEAAYDRMPILADALMDAGCDNEEMIAHCQGPGPHLLGCWVLDLLLGKG
jgi:hypothetical protein